MDTRRDPDPREKGSKPELGTDTVPVELVELQSVGSTGRAVSPRALLAVAVIGVIGFAAIVGYGKLPTPTQSPSASAISLASASPAATPTAAPATARPTPAPPTPRPTPPPPWQWLRSDFLPDLNPSVEGIWAVNGNILALVSRYDPAVDRESWFIARQVSPNGWDLLPAPPAVDQFFAGTVVDDRLWFFAGVGGVTDEDTTWQLVSTADGATWDSQGTAQGLPLFDGASSLTRTGDAWVIVTERDRGEGSSNGAISWSVDGRRWEPADVPELRANVGYTRVASIGDVAIILGFEFDTAEDAGWFTLRSTDGRTWQRSSLAPPSSGSPRELACNEKVCIITLEPPAQLSTGQALMESADGEHWAEVIVDVPYNNPDSTIRSLTTTAAGFLGLSGSPAHAVLSTDGVTWRAIEVLSPDNRDYISDLAVAGDTIVALVPWQSSDEPYRILVGSLAAMGN